MVKVRYFRLGKLGYIQFFIYSHVCKFRYSALHAINNSCMLPFLTQLHRLRSECLWMCKCEVMEQNVTFLPYFLAFVFNCSHNNELINLLSAGAVLKLTPPCLWVPLPLGNVFFQLVFSLSGKKVWQIGAGCVCACMHMCMCLFYSHLEPLRTWSHKVLSIFISCWLFGGTPCIRHLALMITLIAEGKKKAGRVRIGGRWERVSEGLWPKALNPPFSFCLPGVFAAIRFMAANQLGHRTSHRFMGMPGFYLSLLSTE